MIFNIIQIIFIVNYRYDRSIHTFKKWYVVRQNIKKNGGDGLNLTAIPMHVS